MKQLIIILTSFIMNTVIHAQNWVDSSLYPFEGKYIELESGKMHYIDEGKGDVILFVHGTPTWSFLYRDFVKDLSQHYRCIAIDHIGFGLSDKPVSFGGQPQDHAENLSRFIEKLDLNNITLVVHDFGGPIGLAVGIEQAERISKVVLFNSWLWSNENNPAALEIDKFVNSEMGKEYYLKQNYSPTVLLKGAFYDKANLSEQEHQHYINAFPSEDSRQSLLKIGKSFLGASDWYQAQWNQLSALAQKDWLILWGTQDPFLSTEFMNKWKTRIPEAKLVEMECGHFVQEEKTKESIEEIRNFLK